VSSARRERVKKILPARQSLFRGGAKRLNEEQVKERTEKIMGEPAAQA